MLMGVSASILEYVIFCHQDEALWPFSDQANLKKIFDEVFDTTKYTKALTELRQVSKKYSKYAKEFKHELELQTTVYDRYLETKRKLNTYEKKVSELETKAKEAKQKKEGLDSELSELRKKDSQLMLEENNLRNEQCNLDEKRRKYQQIQKEIGLDCTIESQLEAKEKELNDLK